jgi:hypothetical protein
MYCTFTLDAGPGKTVYLTYNSFDTEANYDFWQVFNGPDATAPLASKTSGQLLNVASYQTTQRYAYITFTSDASIDFPGVVASVSNVGP